MEKPEKIINVYYLYDRRIEDYSYDAGGNRTRESIEQREVQAWDYRYYPNSNRLMTNERFAFVYDDTGNLIEKGSSFTMLPNSTGVKINPNEGEYWKYHYDLLNRLIKVEQNGEVVANYKYDEAGLRLKKETEEQTIYYIFNLSGQVIYEQEDTDYTEYLYVFNRHFARVDGNLVTEERTTYFYHTDHLGSTVLVTNELGKTVWSSEYTPFGSLTADDTSFNKAIKFTGKDLDLDIGLYYFNARWYDQDIGRFISEDPAKDGLNWYTYVMNNPMKFIDPTGLSIKDWWANVVSWFKGPDSEGNAVGQLALETHWQIMYSDDPSPYIAGFQDTVGIDATGKINDETMELLDSYGQWYLMNNNISWSDYMLAKWRHTDEQVYWRFTNPDYQRKRAIENLYTAYVVYSLASLGFEAYQEFAASRATTNVTKWFDSKGNTIWPPNDGAVAGTEKNVMLEKGYRFDRFGSYSGSYVSPVGTPYAMRTLAPGTENQPYRVFEVVKPVRGKAGVIAPWFDQPGGGIQFKLDSSVDNLLKSGKIIEVIK